MTERARAADELLDIVDEHDRVVGQRPRGEVYAERLRHRSTSIRVRDARGRLFVHRRTPTKLIFPGMYDVVVGGVVGAGEDYDTAALREAEEELGVQGLAMPERRTRFLFETPEYSWFLAVYEVVCTLPVRPQAEEVEWWDFLAEEELERRLAGWERDGLVVPDGLECHRRLSAL
ncbi:NUDIX domain-containing protein [Streptomyces tubbatahanensis]|uniref:NUDIX domain-containing protein n=1 Tax=Streptomyces tubbatahanensis TaxID=2923272 RepID=A0ABY3XPA2_9ACTN|nr:NUDIX domain-containing protein [Streptomyces tubbatahanensis]UNS96204.1 NUDIX domain-containing protein [Streptomyces tubbatahanensis]